MPIQIPFLVFLLVFVGHCAAQTAASSNTSSSALPPGPAPTAAVPEPNTSSPGLLNPLSFNSSEVNTFKLGRFEILRLLREDCRKIRRKARFFISARCQFEVLKTEHQTWATYYFKRYAVLEEEDKVERDEGLSTKEFATLEEKTKEPEYDPRLDPDLVRRDRYIEEQTRRKEARVALQWQQAKKMGVTDELLQTAIKPKEKENRNVLILSLKSASFIRDSRIRLEYKLTWRNRDNFQRELLRVDRDYSFNLPAQPQPIPTAPSSAVESPAPTTTSPNEPK